MDKFDWALIPFEFREKIFKIAIDTCKDQYSNHRTKDKNQKLEYKGLCWQCELTAESIAKLLLEFRDARTNNKQSS